jgi:D-3-phosphoglycerate dehydrogenase
MKILLIDTIHPVFVERMEHAGHRVADGTSMNREQVLGCISEYDGIVIRSRLFIDREFLDAAKSLIFIARAGAGMESIDEEAATLRGVRLVNSPEGNRDAVAEHAIGMLLSLMNHLGRSDREVREGKWLREHNRGTEIMGKTVGIIGYGNMGKAFAKRLSGFGVTLLAHDIRPDAFVDDCVRSCTLEELCERSDIISLHVPLNASTRQMVDSAFIARCSKSFYLINTARGKVVDTEALVAALESGKVKGAALDVLEYEKHSFEDFFSDPDMPEPLRYLIQSDKVILSPHIAGWTFESYRKIAEVLAEKILAQNHGN